MNRSSTAALAILAVLALTGCSVDLIVGEQQATRDAGLGFDGGTDGGAVMPDAGSADAGPHCAMLPGCGCPPGQTCGANSDSFVCRPLGTAMPDDECVGSPDCAADMGCLAYEETGGSDGPGVCTRFCCSDADCESGTCLQNRDTPDGVGLCASSCDPVRGAGCPASQVCRMLVLSRVDMSSVVASVCYDEGPSTAGQLCSWHEDCEETLFCAFPSARPPGEYSCRQVCARDTDCAAAPCLAILDEVGEVLGSDVGYCASDCDVLTGAGCSGSLACRVSLTRRFDSSTVWFSNCQPDGDRLRDQSCDSFADCQAGHVCADSVCRQLCTLSGGSCDGGGTCTDFVDPIRVRGVDYGACVR